MAAEVAETCPLERTSLLEKTKHLGIIHGTAKELWPMLVRAMMRNGWSATDTEHWVKKAKEFVAKKDGAAIDERWARWLPLSEVVAHFLQSREFSPQTVTKLIQLAESIEATIRAYEHVIDAESYLQAFYAWLEAGREDRSTWDAVRMERGAFRERLENFLRENEFEI